MSNNDFVDWSRAAKAPQVVLENDDKESVDSFPSRHSDFDDETESKPLPQAPTTAPTTHIVPPPSPAARSPPTPSPPLSPRDNRSERSASSRSSRDSRRSVAEQAAELPLPASRPQSSSPPPPPLPPVEATASIPTSGDMPRRTMPVPKKYSASEENDDYEILQEKEALLQDILGYERPPHNVKLTRQWNVQLHTLDELQFEYDRIQSELNANQMVDMAKSGIKFGIGGLEMFLKQSGFHAVDGWYKNSCGDMNKYNRPLIKLYNRYWRKTSMSPIMELGFLMFGSLAWTVAENKMGLRSSSASSSPPVPSAPAAPRGTEYEPPAGPPRTGAMRPPSLGGALKGPRWTDVPSDTPPAPSPSPAPAVATAPSPPPAPTAQPATDPALLATLSSISQQNALMLQVLQSMKKSTPPASPKARGRHDDSPKRRYSISSHSSGATPVRISLKSPKLKGPGTARSRREAASVMAL